LRIAARSHPFPDGIAEIRPLDAPDLSFEAIDSMVMEQVYWFGVQGYEGRVADIWASLCQRAGSVLEIGGNVGLFTVVGGRAAEGRQYTVVEPVPEVAAVLRRNLQRNGLTAVEILEAAAIPDPAPRAVSLNIPSENRDMPVGAHLLDGVEIAARSSLRVISTNGIPFRSLMEGRDLVKIDAEGAEFSLLHAARDIILHLRPTLLIEVLPEAERLGQLLADLANQANYSIYILPEFGSEQIVKVSPAQFSAHLPQRYNSKDVVLTTSSL
jgi:FkbM family methyltransferase